MRIRYTAVVRALTTLSPFDAALFNAGETFRLHLGGVDIVRVNHQCRETGDFKYIRWMTVDMSDIYQLRIAYISHNRSVHIIAKKAKS